MPKSAQLELLFPSTWGGARKGAGRKSKSLRAGVSHLRREPLSSHHPLHVTMRLCKGLPCLNALRYVMHNAKHHGLWVSRGVDRFTSAAWFRGWAEELVVSGLGDVAPPVVEAKTWLLRIGWRRHGLIGVHEVPGRRPG